jgi:hypothetical protein
VWNVRRKKMKQRLIRIALVVLEALVALSAISGGLWLAAGKSGLPMGWLAGTPFSDYTIPGLLLAIVVGGCTVLAAATVFIHREWAVVVSGAAGLLMAGYEVVRFVMIGHFDWFYEFSFIFGVAIFGLAAYLWMTEYRSHHFPTRQGSPV